MKIYRLGPNTRRQQLPYSKLEQEWFGKTLEPAFEYRLSFDAELLYFEVRRNKACRILASAKAGEFTPLLWHEDVAEMFIYNTKTGCYREINLAANAAWWVELFAASRQACRDYIERKLNCSATADEQGWSACAEIPLGWLGEDLQQQLQAGRHCDIAGYMQNHLRFAVCAILESPEQLFVTTTPHHPEATPDFHCREDFLQPQLIEL